MYVLVQSCVCVQVCVRVCVSVYVCQQGGKYIIGSTSPLLSGR